MSRTSFVSLAVVLALCPSTTNAAWGPDNILTLGGSTHYGLSWATIVPAGGGDLYAIWHWGPSSPYQSGASRVTTEGALQFTSYQDWRTYPQGVALDGTGGVIEAFSAAPDPNYPFTQQDIAFRRTTPTGSSEPPYWPAYWAHESTASYSESYPAVATDPAGGAYIAWLRSGRYYLQRVTTAGAIAPPWSSLGRIMLPIMGFSFSTPALLPDGSGGVYMLAAGDFIRAWRIQSDTTMAAGWPTTGVTLNTPGTSYAGGSSPSDLALVAGPTGHTFAIWIEGVSGSKSVAVRSFDGAGNPDGPVLEFAGDATALTAQGDGQGGVLVAWQEGGTLKIAHVLANGAPGAWPLTVVAGGVGRGVATGPNGGFLVFWGDYNGLWGKWYLADGTPDPSEPVSPRLVHPPGPTHPDMYPLAAYSDGDGGAYLLFDEIGGATSIARMMHVFPAGSVVGAGPAARGSGLAFSVAPNPARDELRLAMTIASDQAASIELLDVAGRRLLSRTLPAGASAREERIALPSGLPSGLYLVSLRQGSQVTTRRFAIIQ